MKFDKEALIKHRFWVLAVTAVPLALVAIFLLLTTVSAAIGEKKKKITSKLEELAKTEGDIPSTEDIAKAAQRADEAKGKESGVHREAYEPQAKLSFWPAQIEREYQFADGLFVNKVEVKDMPEKKEDWPKDEADKVHHGVIGTLHAEYFTLKDRDDKELKFNRTAKVEIHLPDAKGPQPFNQLYNAPAGKLLVVSYQRGKFFGDPLTDTERITYQTAYITQIEPILTQVNPLQAKFDAKGTTVIDGVVQFKNYTFKKGDLPPVGNKLIRYVDPWVITTDISDEAWMAQEDLWVHNELYRLVRAANDSVSKFEPIMTGTGKEAKQVVDPKTGAQWFRNPYFDLALRLVKDKLEITIANRLPRRQRLDMELLVQFNPDTKIFPAEKVRVPGTPLGPRGGGEDRRTITQDLVAGAKRSGIFAVEQVLTWETAAVRRVDQVTVASAAGDEIAHSHRTVVKGLLPYKEKKVEAAAAAPAGGENPMGGLGPAPGPMGAGVGGLPGFGGGLGGGAGGNKDMTPNGLWTERYVEIIKQADGMPLARRIPVGVALIVDQEHIDRVMTAFLNSKMRLLPTQVLINHYQGSLKPAGQERPRGTEGGGPGVPGFPGLPGPMGAFPGPTGAFPGPMGGEGGEGGEGGVPGSAAATQDTEANIEFVLYGIVTLYERPDRSAAAPGAAAPAAAPAATN